jgi:hypothetical protein
LTAERVCSHALNHSLVQFVLNLGSVGEVKGGSHPKNVSDMRLLGGGPRRWQSTMNPRKAGTTTGTSPSNTVALGVLSATHPLEHRSWWIPASVALLGSCARSEKEPATAASLSRLFGHTPPPSHRLNGASLQFECKSTSFFEMDVSVKRLNWMNEHYILHSHIQQCITIRFAYTRQLQWYIHYPTFPN